MPVAELVLKNAKVITVDVHQPQAGLVAIAGGRILLVGSNGDLESISGPGTRVIDCCGKTVVPGFNDAHCHVFSFIRKLTSIDLSSMRSIADIKAAIHRQVQNTPPGKWITATSYNEFYLAEKRHPNRWDIDEVAPDHPVVLSHRGLHACVLNSRALALAGITSETPGPPWGVIDRDLATGEPNGILFEMLAYIREKVMPPMTEEELTKGVTLASQHYLSCGITSLQEASVNNDYSRWQNLRRFADNSRLQSRVYMMVGGRALDQFREAGLVTGSGDSQVRLGGVKFMLSEATGRLQPSQPELNQMALDCHRAGFQLAFHAVQESTVTAAINALEYITSHELIAGRRHRIEHCAECPPNLLARLSRLQPVVATQPPFLYYSGERYLATVPASQLPWLYRFKSLINAGLTVAASSDSPVVPANPLFGIYVAVTRQAESGQRLQPEEGISATQALAMYTVNGAYASFEENIKGSIVPGKLADLVVLSDDLTRVPPEKIKEIKVEVTIIGGKVVWEA